MDRISVVNFFLSYPITSKENNELREKQYQKLQQQLQEEYDSGAPEYVITSSVEECLERINEIQLREVKNYLKMYATV